MIKGTLYTTVGSRRGVAALDPGTGEIRWLHTENEGVGQSAPRNGAGAAWDIGPAPMGATSGSST
jgi:hypothetical protein